VPVVRSGPATRPEGPPPTRGDSPSASEPVEAPEHPLRRPWTVARVGRRRVVGLLAALLCLGVGLQLTWSSKSAKGARPITASGLTWESGASGKQAEDGSYAAWRGRRLDIIGTWADNPQASISMWMLQPGAGLSATAWHGDIDLAVGAIGTGESWASAASGAYDARWATSLTNLRTAWGSRPGTVYLRFAHEMNGNWYPWSVNPSNVSHFLASWSRYRALQKKIMPNAKLVFSVNRESSGMGMDWRRAFPGRDQVDLMSVDYYNQYPFVRTAQEWTQSITQTDGYGAPKGLRAHLAFAKSVGLPLAISEWSNNADQGDSAAFMEGLHSFFVTNSGTGPGKLLYEVQFNVDQDATRWALFPATRAPQAAAAYRRLW